MGAIQDEGGGLTVCVVEDPLYLDRGEGCTGGKGFGIGADGLPAFSGPGIDGRIPGQVFDFNVHIAGSDPDKCLFLKVIRY